MDHREALRNQPQVDFENVDHGCCSSCHLVLHQPFIRCQGCRGREGGSGSKSAEQRRGGGDDDDVRLCLRCFSSGREIPGGGHRSWHDYSVVQTDFPVFEGESGPPKWVASEELLLLEALVQFGYGNWQDIANKVPTRTASECRRHFDRFYLHDDDGGDADHHQKPAGSDAQGAPPPAEPHPRTAAASLCGPAIIRSESDRSDPALLKEVDRIYNAARSDFDCEFRNSAEICLNSLEVGDDHYRALLLPGPAPGAAGHEGDGEDRTLLARLGLAMLDVYQDQLKQRLKRKRLVREFSLLPPQNGGLGTGASSGRLGFHGIVGTRLEWLLQPRVRRLTCAFDHDFLLEGLRHEMMLRRKVALLQELRENCGIQSRAGIRVFRKQRSLRTDQLRAASSKEQDGGFDGQCRKKRFNCHQSSSSTSSVKNAHQYG